jgi:hypothetical protein
VDGATLDPLAAQRPSEIIAGPPRDDGDPRIDPRSGVGLPSRPGLGMCDADGDHERTRPR